MLTQQSNPHEQLARAAKVRKLANVLDEFQIGSELAALMDDRNWREVALAAQVNEPGPKTRPMVIAELREREKRVRRFLR